jgi:hypothetical protein
MAPAPPARWRMIRCSGRCSAGRHTNPRPVGALPTAIPDCRGSDRTRKAILSTIREARRLIGPGVEEPSRVGSTPVGVPTPAQKLVTKFRIVGCHEVGALEKPQSGSTPNEKALFFAVMTDRNFRSRKPAVHSQFPQRRRDPQTKGQASFPPVRPAIGSRPIRLLEPDRSPP